MSPPGGDELPAIHTAVPGPASRSHAARLARVESRNVTHRSAEGPIFWAAARGANVRDVDGNTYIDLTAGFGVAHAGHSNVRVAAAIAAQAERLPHGLGDVHPPEVKLRLLERLAALAPAPLGVAVLGSAGAEAIEIALKTAALRSARPGILAFEGAYHGLTYGALATTWRSDFRAPFASQLFNGVRFAPFPYHVHGAAAPDLELALDAVRQLLHASEESVHPIGAVLVEPLQGRGGLRPAADGFLAGLRELCDGSRRVLIFDEVYTGFGRTGRWFACEHARVSPDILVVGKALTGSVPLSAAIGSPDVMSAWPDSTGEAIHTSTFLGNPVACAAALAQLEEIESRDLLGRARRLGERIATRTASWRRLGAVLDARGLGLLHGVRLEPGRALRVCNAVLPLGVIVLAEGDEADVLAITPPAAITDAQLDFALDVIERALRAE